MPLTASGFGMAILGLAVFMLAILVSLAVVRWAIGILY